MNEISRHDFGSILIEWVNWKSDENELEMFMEGSGTGCLCIKHKFEVLRKVEDRYKRTARVVDRLRSNNLYLQVVCR